MGIDDKNIKISEEQVQNSSKLQPTEDIKFSDGSTRFYGIKNTLRKYSRLRNIVG